MKSTEIVDDPNNFPYTEIKQGIYEGLGVFNYSFMLRFYSDHFESKAISGEVQRNVSSKRLFKALRLADVILQE